MPVSELKIRVHPDVPFIFDVDAGGTEGVLTAHREVPLESEAAHVAISAVDKAGNRDSAWISINAPRVPPDVHLVLINPGNIVYPDGKVNVGLLGDCYDPSGVDHRKTRVSIDGANVTPWRLEENRWKGEPDLVFFGTRVEEGRHWARIEVADRAGLSAVADISFDVTFKPKITQFKRFPQPLQMSGGPAFTAKIKDPGNDLGKEGLHFTIDGVPVGSDRLFYAPDNGYFAVDGPFSFSRIPIPPGCWPPTTTAIRMRRC